MFREVCLTFRCLHHALWLHVILPSACLLVLGHLWSGCVNANLGLMERSLGRTARCQRLDGYTWHARQRGSELIFSCNGSVCSGMVFDQHIFHFCMHVPICEKHTPLSAHANDVQAACSCLHVEILLHVLMPETRTYKDASRPLCSINRFVLDDNTPSIPTATTVAWTTE